MTRILVADSSRIHTRLLAESLMREGDLKVMAFESDSSGLVSAASNRQLSTVRPFNPIAGLPMGSRALPSFVVVAVGDQDAERESQRPQRSLAEAISANLI